ncbi:MAG: DUF6057 family protein [Tannerellaceae bacterium]|nr:DUF6057 family protein [Tannerellaceae bacterium]
MKGEVGFRVLAGAIFLVVCIVFFQYGYPYHLFLKEQIRLFLFTPGYFLSYFTKPAALSCLTGDFLTQFNYLRWGGPVVLGLVLLLEWILCVAVLRRFTKEYFSLVAFFPVVMEWILHYQINYSLAETFSTIFGLLFFLFYVRIRSGKGKALTGLAGILPLYFLTGTGMWVFLWLMLAESIYRKGGWIYQGVCVLFAVFIPFVFRPFYLLTYKQAFLYPATNSLVLVPALLLAVLLVLLLNKPVRFRLTTLAGRGVVLTVLLCFLGLGTYAKANFTREKLLSLDSEAYFGNWERVYRKVTACDLPNPVATYYANLALSYRGEMGEKLMEYYQPASYGLFLNVGPESPVLNIFFSNEAFFHVGDMNMAQHSAMLGMTFLPSARSSRMAKRLAEINLVNEDIPATEKYLRMLDKTLFHRKWAAATRQMLYADPMETNLWLQVKREQRFTSDLLRKGNDHETSLKALVEHHPGNKVALNYLLSWYLLNKDIQSFGDTYDRYGKDAFPFAPRIYGEGLLIWLAGKKVPEEVLKSYKIPTHVISEFVEYTKVYEAANGQGAPLQEKYGRSYWFYYHFAQMRNE